MHAWSVYLKVYNVEWLQYASQRLILFEYSCQAGLQSECDTNELHANAIIFLPGQIIFSGNDARKQTGFCLLKRFHVERPWKPRRKNANHEAEVYNYEKGKNSADILFHLSSIFFFYFSSVSLLYFFVPILFLSFVHFLF